MVVVPILLAAAVNWADAPPVPGRCAAPAAENAGKPGCFLTAELRIDAAPAELWWHIFEFPSTEATAPAAAGKRWAVVTGSHGRSWLHVLGGHEEQAAGATRRARIGPLSTSSEGRPITARFIESIFTPGMRTRVHAHPGLEAFYVLDGEQCMETPQTRGKLRAGETFIVPVGPHVQAAAKGRRNIALVLHAPDAAWMTMAPGWSPSQYCAD